MAKKDKLVVKDAKPMDKDVTENDRSTKFAFRDALSNYTNTELDSVIGKNAIGGKPLFTDADLQGVVHTLTLFVRAFCIQQNLSREEFIRRHKQMDLSNCKPTNKASHDRFNALSALTNNLLTWNALEKIIGIIGYDIADVKLTLVDRETGEVIDLSKNEILKKVMQKPKTSLMEHVKDGFIDD